MRGLGRCCRALAREGVRTKTLEIFENLTEPEVRVISPVCTAGNVEAEVSLVRNLFLRYCCASHSLPCPPRALQRPEWLGAWLGGPRGNAAVQVGIS